MRGPWTKIPLFRKRCSSEFSLGEGGWAGPGWRADLLGLMLERRRPCQPIPSLRLKVRHERNTPQQNRLDPLPQTRDVFIGIDARSPDLMALPIPRRFGERDSVATLVPRFHVGHFYNPRAGNTGRPTW